MVWYHTFYYFVSSMSNIGSPFHVVCGTIMDLSVTLHMREFFRVSSNVIRVIIDLVTPHLLQSYLR